MAIPVQITFDCAEPRRLARFWGEVLGYDEQPPPDGFDSWEDALRAWNVPEDLWDAKDARVDPEGRGPRLWFQRVPEGKRAKNRVHLDVNVTAGVAPEASADRLSSEVERVLSLGATKVEEREELGDRWVVMQDPEGNEFCLQ